MNALLMYITVQHSTIQQFSNSIPLHNIIIFFIFEIHFYENGDIKKVEMRVLQQRRRSRGRVRKNEEGVREDEKIRIVVVIG